LSPIELSKLKKHYPWLWFDADGTLFDYNLAEATALQKAFELLSLQFQNDYLNTYREINGGLWQALERQEIKPEVLRVRRFELLLEALGVSGIPDQLSTTYIEQLALFAELMDGACEVLQTLHKTSRVAIVTNGLQAVQRSRLENSTIKEFISELIISEEVGAAKPSAAFFDAAFAQTGHPPQTDVLIIGDSLTSDMRGGVDYGIDTCWYNPAGEAKPEGLPITYEIRHLRELLELLN
jgi:2-haloacid dehalogenase